MKPNRLATIGLIAAASLFGTLTASAAPVKSLGAPSSEASLVTQAGYACWWSYGRKHCAWRGGHAYYHHPYHHRRYYRY